MIIHEEVARAFAIAEKIALRAKHRGVDVAIIGAAALAAHKYPRSTKDIDLGFYGDPGLLYTLKAELASDGVPIDDIHCMPCDDTDALGGVLRIEGADHDRVDLVNFCNPFTASFNPGIEAFHEANVPVEGYQLVAVKLEHLVALALYGGGKRAELDVEELLRANPDADRAAIRAVCARYGLAEKLDGIIASM